MLSLRLIHAMHALTSSDGVKQSMEIRVRSCMYVGMYGIWNYLANQGT